MPATNFGTIKLSESAAAIANTTTPTALTSPADIAAAYVEADIQALRNDVANLHSTVNILVTKLNTLQGVMRTLGVIST